MRMYLNFGISICEFFTSTAILIWTGSTVHYIVHIYSYECTHTLMHARIYSLSRYGRVVVSHKKRELNSLVTSVCVCVYSVSAYTKCD